jgi:hypothetical protein
MNSAGVHLPKTVLDELLSLALPIGLLIQALTELNAQVQALDAAQRQGPFIAQASLPDPATEGMAHHFVFEVQFAGEEGAQDYVDDFSYAVSGAPPGSGTAM